ncbi:putative ribosomal protein L24e/L24 superfamily [Helianthus annuus]|nr:putative ribosomal protein L24e/L24 superfamily [Helianthus annuus]
MVTNIYFFHILCSLSYWYSGQKIYLGRGIRLIQFNSKLYLYNVDSICFFHFNIVSKSVDFLFANFKCKRYFHNKLKPSKLTWTDM